MSGILYPSQKAAKIAGFKVQTSVYDLPIPVVYGTARLPGNLIHMPVTPKIVPNKGKGVNTKGAQSGDVYTAAMIIALCEGPIIGIGNVWRDKDQLVPFTNYSSGGYGLALGSSAQTGWATLPAAQRLGYREIAYVDHPTWPLPNDSLSSYSWEVKGFEIFGSGVVDASPADIIEDYLTSAQYGVGFPSAQLASMTTFQDYCAAFSLFCSPVFSSQQSARDQINELLEISNTGAVWSDGVLKFIPYGDTAATAHGHTFTPNTTPVYDIGNNDYLGYGEGQDPVKVTRKSPIECFNQVPVSYEDRLFDYNSSTIKAEDQFSLLTNGPRPMPTMGLPSIKSETVARQVAQVRLQREQNIRNTYQFRLGWRFILLEPMDLITLTDVGLGLNLTPVRITQVVELDNEQGLEFTAEDWPFGTASATAYQTASNSGTSSDTNVDPGDTAAPVIFDGPPSLSVSAYELWIAASGGSDWGGCDVYISADNANFTKVGTIIGKATYGVLTASLATNARYPSVDTTHTLSVNLTASGGSMVALSQEQFDMLAFPCWIDGEFATYRDLALTSAFHYDLTHLYRGLYTSAIPASHSSAEPFVLCDEHVARIPWPNAVTGQTLYVKLPAFNIYGGSIQDVSTVSSTSFVVGQDAVGRQNAVPQGSVTISVGGAYSAVLDRPSSAQSYKYLTSTSAFPSQASVISGGTIVNDWTTAITGTISFGQTIYITAVPYTYPDAGGVVLPIVHLKGSYQNTVTTKFDTFTAAALVPRDVSAPQFTVDLTTSGIVVVPGANPIKANGTCLVKMTSGLTLDSLEMYAFTNSAHVPATNENASIAIIKVDRTTQISSAVAGIGTSGQSAAVQFIQTTGIGHTVDTSTYGYYVYAWLRDQWFDGGVALYTWTIGYVQNDYSQGM